jgi:hypothetical protein
MVEIGPQITIMGLKEQYLLDLFLAEGRLYFIIKSKVFITDHCIETDSGGLLF